MTLHLDSGEVLPAPQYGNRRYEPLTLKASSPAGGGWGNPLQRDPALVLADVRNGILTREAAARDYGVVLQPNTWAIDDAATQQRRTG
jgi:N-methylhydantoinase B